MDLTRLAAKQKRYKDILSFTENEVMSPSLKPQLLTALANYRSALATSWKKQSCEGDDLRNLDSIERELEKLHNEARLRTSSK